MKTLSLVTLLLLVSGCVSVNNSAICDATARLRDAHASSLLGSDVPDGVVISGVSLLSAIDAGCADK